MDVVPATDDDGSIGSMMNVILPLGAISHLPWHRPIG